MALRADAERADADAAEGVVCWFTTSLTVPLRHNRVLPESKQSGKEPGTVQSSKLLASSINAALAILRVLIVPLAVFGLLAYCGYSLLSGPSMSEPGLSRETRTVVEDA